MTPAEQEEYDFWRLWLSTQGKVSNTHREFLRRINGGPISEPLIEERIQGRGPVRILDVGAGPVTFLGTQHPSAQIGITATDRLAREYGVLLAEFGIKPPVHTLPVSGEGLLTWFLPIFNFTYARNSLDHSSDPVTIIDNMARLTVQGGYLILRHHPMEGERERYRGLHQWNFKISQDQPYDCWVSNGKNRARNISEMLSYFGSTTAWIEGDWLIVMMQKDGK